MAKTPAPDRQTESLVPATPATVLIPHVYLHTADPDCTHLVDGDEYDTDCTSNDHGVPTMCGNDTAVTMGDDTLPETLQHLGDTLSPDIVLEDAAGVMNLTHHAMGRMDVDNLCMDCWMAYGGSTLPRDVTTVRFDFNDPDGL